ncbi:Hypothetical predicted protein [Olea europaea subsp. europaea]|uniref:Uncharacterized protein n=1 Tax=Olea europaea subsp. europaea TaxID=158383 RepID=A0A8S0TNS8_OLEEU|nr:Hypothetical predicted protein [Olea europaea subsp. europaea]
MPSWAQDPPGRVLHVAAAAVLPLMRMVRMQMKLFHGHAVGHQSPSRLIMVGCGTQQATRSKNNTIKQRCILNLNRSHSPLRLARPRELLLPRGLCIQRGHEGRLRGYCRGKAATTKTAEDDHGDGDGRNKPPIIHWTRTILISAGQARMWRRIGLLRGFVPGEFGPLVALGRATLPRALELLFCPETNCIIGRERKQRNSRTGHAQSTCARSTKRRGLPAADPQCQARHIFSFSIGRFWPARKCAKSRLLLASNRAVNKTATMRQTQRGASGSVRYAPREGQSAQVCRPVVVEACEQFASCSCVLGDEIRAPAGRCRCVRHAGPKRRFTCVPFEMRTPQEDCGVLCNGIGGCSQAEPGWRDMRLECVITSGCSPASSPYIRNGRSCRFVPPRSSPRLAHESRGQAGRRAVFFYVSENNKSGVACCCAIALPPPVFAVEWAELRRRLFRVTALDGHSQALLTGAQESSAAAAAAAPDAAGQE